MTQDCILRRSKSRFSSPHQTVSGQSHASGGRVMDDNNLISPLNSSGKNSNLLPAIFGGLAALFVGAAAVGGGAALGARRRRHMTEGYLLGQEDERADNRRRALEAERNSANTAVSDRLARLEKETLEEFRRLAEDRATEARERAVEAEVQRRMAAEQPVIAKKAAGGKAAGNKASAASFSGAAGSIGDPNTAKLFTQMMGELRVLQGRLARMEQSQKSVP